MMNNKEKIARAITPGMGVIGTQGVAIFRKRALREIPNSFAA